MPSGKPCCGYEGFRVRSDRMGAYEDAGGQRILEWNTGPTLAEGHAGRIEIVRPTAHGPKRVRGKGVWALTTRVLHLFIPTIPPGYDNLLALYARHITEMTTLKSGRILAVSFDEAWAAPLGGIAGVRGGDTDRLVALIQSGWLAKAQAQTSEDASHDEWP
jgi:hypothetical protein